MTPKGRGHYTSSFFPQTLNTTSLLYNRLIDMGHDKKNPMVSKKSKKKKSGKGKRNKK
jgi:hypothetical protein